MTGTEQVHNVWDIVTTCIRHSLSYDMIIPGIYTIQERYISGMYLVYICHISFISESHEVQGSSLLPLHEVTLSSEKSLLQHSLREGWAKRKQQWKYTSFEYRVQAYGIWQVYTRYIPLTGPWPEPEWHRPGKSTGGRRIPSFYRPCPLFKHQRHV